jgi:hypothetical protein
MATVGIWMLVCGLVLYLGFDGGGYGVVAHSQVAIIVWWTVLIGAAWGLLPAARISGLGWAALALFGGFGAWTALGITWSISFERSLADLSLLAGYLGVLVLGLGFHTDRTRALRQTIAALATSIVIVAVLALASRLHPGLFQDASQTASFLPGTSGRLAWPLNYWNALAALLAFGLPLLLALATSARTLVAQAAAAAAIPVVALCGYLTFSRGGAVAGAVAVVGFFALAPDRLPKLLTGVITAAGSAALIALAGQRNAIEQGLINGAAHHQGATFILPILLVCAGVALLHVGATLAGRQVRRPKLLVVSPDRARSMLVGAVVVAITVAVVTGVPAKVSHAWHDFKRPSTAALGQLSIARFEAASSNGRYQVWDGALQATAGHLFKGYGPGTFQLVWLPRSPASVGYVRNAHSLYVETLAELGVVGLALLLGFIVTVIGAAITLTTRSGYETRTRAAGAAAALLAFAVSAGLDWIWQVPVLPVAFLLLAGAVLAPELLRSGTERTRASIGLQRVVVALAALGCLVAIGIPLASSNELTASQQAASRGDLSLALRDAQEAARVEPGAASPRVQLALVEERQGNVRAALRSAEAAARDEPANWSTWLIISRLDAEAGKARASYAAFRRARALNPNSPLFLRGRHRVVRRG